MRDVAVAVVAIFSDSSKLPAIGCKRRRAVRVVILRIVFSDVLIPAVRFVAAWADFDLFKHIIFGWNGFLLWRQLGRAGKPSRIGCWFACNPALPCHLWPTRKSHRVRSY